MLPSDHYKPPSFLQDLHVLDLLELTGSQARAGRALAMHQSTVCRSLRLLQKDLRLTPANGSAVCRHGHNTCLHHLRLACRAHRLMAGVLRIGTDVLHHNLIMRCGAAQPVPPRFRRAEHWAELIRHGLLDGAILSSLALEKRLLSGQAPRLEGISARPLGMISLQLVATTADAQRVLLPAQATAPLLHQGIAAQGLGIEKQPAACQEPEAWLKRARDRGLALPIIPALVAENWLSMQGLTALREQPLLIEQLWLLIALGISNNASQRLLRQLRSLVRNSETMLNSHEDRD